MSLDVYILSDILLSLVSMVENIRLFSGEYVPTCGLGADIAAVRCVQSTIFVNTILGLRCIHQQG